MAVRKFRLCKSRCAQCGKEELMMTTRPNAVSQLRAPAWTRSIARTFGALFAAIAGVIVILGAAWLMGGGIH
jgi:hypothetical protein